MWPNSRSIALPVITLLPPVLALFPPVLALFPPVLALFPPFFGPILAGVLFPAGLPLFRVEPGVEASPKL
jgi:hypothetical protein